MHDEGDHFGRYGGEEWLFIFKEDNPEYIQEIFQRIREKLSTHSIEGLPESHMVTFSMGAVRFESDKYQSISDMISKADQLLYDAKEQGRDRLVCEYQVS